MKKLLVLLNIGLISIAAHAASTVTLYGLLDDGVVYVNNQLGGVTVKSVTGQTNASRFGFRGSEDLGGGLSAIFTLENGFDMSTGKLAQNGRLFGRQAFVGLSSPFGALTAGRQNVPTYEYVGTLAGANLWGWFGTHPGDFDNLFATVRLDNSLKYTSPGLGPVTLEGVVATGGVPGSVSQNSSYSFGAKYDGGPLRAALAFVDSRDPSVPAFDGTVARGTAGYTSPVTNPVYRGYASANTLTIFASAVSYTLGPITGGLVFTNTRFINVQPSATTPFRGGTARFNSYEANLQYQITPSFLVGTTYDYTVAPTAHYGQLDIGADYLLSKRTDINLVGVWQRASGTNSMGVPAVANISSLSASSNANQVAAKISLRTRF